MIISRSGRTGARAGRWNGTALFLLTGVLTAAGLSAYGEDQNRKPRVKYFQYTDRIELYNVEHGISAPAKPEVNNGKILKPRTLGEQDFIWDVPPPEMYPFDVQPDRRRKKAKTKKKKNWILPPSETQQNEKIPDFNDDDWISGRYLNRAEEAYDQSLNDNKDSNEDRAKEDVNNIEKEALNRLADFEEDKKKRFDQEVRSEHYRLTKQERDLKNTDDEESSRDTKKNGIKIDTRFDQETTWNDPMVEVEATAHEIQKWGPEEVLGEQEPAQEVGDPFPQTAALLSRMTKPVVNRLTLSREDLGIASFMKNRITPGTGNLLSGGITPAVSIPPAKRKTLVPGSLSPSDISRSFSASPVTPSRNLFGGGILNKPHVGFAGSAIKSINPVKPLEALTPRDNLIQPDTPSGEKDLNKRFQLFK